LDNPIIKIENLVYSYPDADEEALNGVSFSVEKGEFVAILGHNGSGKSTLARMLNGILTPDSGEVLINGMRTTDEEKIYDIRQCVGMVFQNPDNQIIATVVEEDVAFGPENLGVPSRELRSRVDEALKAVDMYEWRRHTPHLLSGGQKQRVAIAGVIAMRPDCIVLDEPTAMLDPRGRDEVMETIKALNRGQGITVILITHHMQEAAEADRIIALDHGRILLEGSPRGVFSKVEILEEAGLGVPQATMLAYRLGCARTTLTIEECAEEILKQLR